MQVLSLFDGISCGRLALERAGIKVEAYLASEINKYAIGITKYNFPDVVQLGDIRNLDGKDFRGVDLLIGGSPCTDFSMAGRRKGMITQDNIEVVSLEQYLELKEQGFEFFGQSYLFWEYVRLLKEIKPRYFLLENVVMEQKWENLISQVLQTHPIILDSAIVSAQRRVRLYWTNIPVKSLPDNKHLIIKDILDNQNAERFIYDIHPFIIYKSSFASLFNPETDRFDKPIIIGEIPRIKVDIRRYIYSLQGKSPTLTGKYRDYKIPYKNTIRTFTELEFERLQTLPDNYTAKCIIDNKVKNTPLIHRFSTVGNGWTVDVIAHFFKFLKGDVL